MGKKQCCCLRYFTEVEFKTTHSYMFEIDLFKNILILHILYHPTWKRNWFDIICQHMSNCFQGVYKIQLVNLMRRRILGIEGKVVHRPQRVAGPDRSRLTSYTRLIKDTPMQNKKPIIVHMQWRCYADLAFKLNKMTLFSKNPISHEHSNSLALNSDISKLITEKHASNFCSQIF